MSARRKMIGKFSRFSMLEIFWSCVGARPPMPYFRYPNSVMHERCRGMSTPDRASKSSENSRSRASKDRQRLINQTRVAKNLA